MREDPKAYDPSYIKIYDKEASNQEGAFCTKYVKKSNLSKSAPAPDLEHDQHQHQRKLSQLQLSDIQQLSFTEIKNLDFEQVKHIALFNFLFLLHLKEQESKNMNAPRN